LEVPKYLFAGPLVGGIRNFDKQCIFGNDMYLTELQQEFLEGYCEEEECYEEESMKYYVHRMTKSNVIPKKCKMVRIYSCLFYCAKVPKYYSKILASYLINKCPHIVFYLARTLELISPRDTCKCTLMNLCLYLLTAISAQRSMK
jgi:hypothetical protein